MTTTTGGTELLKRDALGRIRVPLAKREEILEEFERKGVSGAEFAELLGLALVTRCREVAWREQQLATFPQDSYESMDIER